MPHRCYGTTVLVAIILEVSTLWCLLDKTKLCIVVHGPWNNKWAIVLHLGYRIMNHVMKLWYNLCFWIQRFNRWKLFSIRIRKCIISNNWSETMLQIFSSRRNDFQHLSSYLWQAWENCGKEWSSEIITLSHSFPFWGAECLTLDKVISTYT